MAARTLLRGATIVTMDAATGTLPRGDLLVEGDRIAAIAPRLEVDDAEVVELGDRILIPGLVNAHLHTWQTGLRGVASDWTLPEYFSKMHAGLATVFRPEDLHAATLAGALNQLDGGTTTLVDWCHANPTPAHDDAALDALHASGLRACFMHGTPKPDPKPGEPGFWEVPHPRAKLERLVRERAHGLVSVGAAILGPHYSTMEVALHDFRLVRELGLVGSMHQGGGPARTPEGWDRLEAEGLLGPRINIVHGHALDDRRLARFCALGMSFSVTPENEMTQGHGFPITGRLRRLGRAPSLGADLESVHSGEMLAAARIALGMQRALDNAAHRDAHGAIPPTTTVPARDALAWATIEGARMLGVEDRIGSLAVGRQADLVAIRCDRLHLQPVHDPIATVVMQSGRGDVDAVMVAGRWRKRDGRLLDADVPALVARLRASGERILSEMGLRPGAALGG
ncbi:MAG TPA: amidohydrolase family protein [Burkholderiaceae bacterium]|nr:amidohydrolase family protein [Burkholderiaceae bacterium]